MAIEVSVLGKCKEADGIDVEFNYTCPHCGESVTDSIFVSYSLDNQCIDIDGRECPECYEENDLEVDLS